MTVWILLRGSCEEVDSLKKISLQLTSESGGASDALRGAALAGRAEIQLCAFIGTGKRSGGGLCAAARARGGAEAVVSGKT